MWHESALELPEPFRVWAAASVASPDPDAVAKALRSERVVGPPLPATALGSPTAVERVGALLDEAERAGKPVLVHPGPAPSADAGLPAWWPALGPYVSQLHLSWLAWHVAGRSRHPGLRIALRRKRLRVEEPAEEMAHEMPVHSKVDAVISAVVPN